MSKPKLNKPDVEPTITTVFIDDSANKIIDMSDEGIKDVFITGMSVKEKPFWQTTLTEDCLKVWEERGWEWSRTTTMIYIAHLTQKKSIGITSNNTVKINGWLDLQDLELLTKTLKVYEVENEK